VGVGPAAGLVVHPTRAPAPKISRTSARYTGARWNCFVLCRVTHKRDAIDIMNPATYHSRYGDDGPGLLGTGDDDVAFVGIAVIATIVLNELAEELPWGIDAGFGVHFAPVSAAGNEQDIVTSPGSVAPVGDSDRFICSMYGVPATTGAGFGVPLLGTKVARATTGNVWF
jgi:hypothetical protein